MELVCRQVHLRYFSTTNRKYKVYRNQIQQKFVTEAPNMIWVSDITYVRVEDILCAIGVIIDLYARKVIAFDVADYIDFFNNIRPHHKLVMFTPGTAEAKFSE